MVASAVRTAEALTTEIADLKMIVPRIHRDRRGFFSETYNKGRLEVLGAQLEFVQDNHSLCVERGAAVHYQIPPFEQEKHVRYPGLEITDVNNFYVQEGNLTLRCRGWWTDAGSFESLLRASNLAAKTGANKMTDIGETAAVMSQEAAR